MAELMGIEAFLDGLLEAQTISDYCPNGVQVRGAERIDRVATGVSASAALFEEAAAWGAQLILVHHGIFWNKDPRVVAGALKKRLKILLEADISLMAYHLPLDRHPQYGNNAAILKRLNLEPAAPFGQYHGATLSWIGRQEPPCALNDFQSRVQALFGGEPLTLPFGPEQIRKVAVCSGGAPEMIREAVAARADLYLTGEAAESVYHIAREEGISFIAAGHHRTEKFGVQALGDLLAGQFGVEHRFFDSDNPI